MRYNKGYCFGLGAESLKSMKQNQHDEYKTISNSFFDSSAQFNIKDIKFKGSQTETKESFHSITRAYLLHLLNQETSTSPSN